MIGDSVLPGQSTAGVTLGALRVAHEIERVVPLTRWRQAAVKREMPAKADDGLTG